MYSKAHHIKKFIDYACSIAKKGQNDSEANIKNTISLNKSHPTKKKGNFMAKSPPEIIIDTPDYRVEGKLLNNKKYVIMGATMPRRGKQIHYTWYLPVTARIWASKGHMPLVFLAGNYTEWENNILGRTAQCAKTWRRGVNNSRN